MVTTMDFLREAGNGWQSKQNSHGQVFQQSVTMHAYMERSPGSSTNSDQLDSTSSDTGWFLWGITEAQLPILVGVAAGGTVLLITMLGLLMWRCCHQRNLEKQYCIHRSEENGDIKNSRSLFQRESQKFYGAKSFTRKNCMGDDNSTIARSQSAPVRDGENLKCATSKKRPQSQPVHQGDYDTGSSSLIEVNSDSTCGGDVDCVGNVRQVVVEAHIANIPEGFLHSCQQLDSEEPGSQYSSSGMLELPLNDRYLHLRDTATLKTRSLPTWVRSRPRPYSTEDDLCDLYAKVSFSKKRKNRMHNDSAAAIAINKSRSQFIVFPFMHKDTDSLVDNEATVVYDERTAL